MKPFHIITGLEPLVRNSCCGCENGRGGRRKVPDTPRSKPISKSDEQRVGNFPTVYGGQGVTIYIQNEWLSPSIWNRVSKPDTTGLRANVISILDVCTVAYAITLSMYIDSPPTATAPAPPMSAGGVGYLNELPAS